MSITVSSGMRILFNVSPAKIRIHSRKRLPKVVAKQKDGRGVFINLRPWEK